MPLPPTVSCFSKIQIGFTFLIPAHPRSPGQGHKGPLNGCCWRTDVRRTSFMWSESVCAWTKDVGEWVIPLSSVTMSTQQFSRISRQLADPSSPGNWLRKPVVDLCALPICLMKNPWFTSSCGLMVKVVNICSPGRLWFPSLISYMNHCWWHCECHLARIDQCAQIVRLNRQFTSPSVGLTALKVIF